MKTVELCLGGAQRQSSPPVATDVPSIYCAAAKQKLSVQNKPINGDQKGTV